MTADMLPYTPEDQLREWEKKFVSFVSISDLLVDDVKNKMNDPNAFPGRMPISTLKELPPAVVCTSEFDTCLRDCEYLRSRLQEAGTLLDYQNIPGMHHGYQYDGNCKETTWFYEECSIAFKKYVMGNQT